PRAGATHPGSRARTGPRSGAPAGAAPVSRSTRPPGSAAAGARSPACSGTESRPLADPAPGTTATTGDAVGLGPRSLGPGRHPQLPGHGRQGQRAQGQHAVVEIAERERPAFLSPLG